MSAPAQTQIQSISIPSTSTRSSPSPQHTVYNISVTTPTHTYTVSHRYSDFDSLQGSLARELGTGPPGELPPKRAGSGWTLGLIGSKQLSEPQLRERQLGLERWLRGLVAARDARWAASRSLRNFLGGPAAGEGKLVSWTAANWLDEYTALEASVKSLRATFAKRDELLVNGSSDAHAVNADAKRGLVDLVKRLGTLMSALHDLARGGMPQGELHRRRDLVGRLQDEAENLGKVAGSAPRAGGANVTSPSCSKAPGSYPASSASRGALLGAHSAPPSRILGAPAAPQESAATRPLDNAGLLQLQQAYVQEQDDKLDSLTAGLRRQRELAERIGEELELHGELLDGLERDVDRVGGRMKDATKQMKRLK